MEKVDSGEIKQANSLILGIQSPELRENKFLLCEPPSLWYLCVSFDSAVPSPGTDFRETLTNVRAEKHTVFSAVLILIAKKSEL